MVDPLPPYPPPHDAWRFPPPPVSRRWLWGAIAASVGATVAIVALVASVVVAGTTDVPASIDDPELVDAIDSGCQRLTDGVDLIEVHSLAVDRVGRVEAQTAVVREVLQGWRDLDADLRASDRPFDDWLDDWQRLVDARDAYVVELQGNPQALFEEPEVDGERVTERMDSVMTGCPVPSTLLRPDAGIARQA